jgi:class 3 adenylate cyclase
MKIMSQVIQVFIIIYLALLNLHGYDKLKSIDGYLIPDESFLIHIGDIDRSKYADIEKMITSIKWENGDEIDGEDLDQAPVYLKLFRFNDFNEDTDQIDPSNNYFVVVESYDTDVRLYHNNTPLYSSSRIENKRLNFLFYPVSLKSNDTLLFRVTANPYAGEEIYLIHGKDIEKARTLLPLLYIYQEIPTILFAFFTFLIALGILGIYFFKRKKDSSLLWFGLFALTYTLFVIFKGNFINTLYSVEPLYDFYITQLAQDLMPVFLLLFYLSFMKDSYYKFFYLLIVGQIVVMIIHLYVMLNGHYFEWSDLLSLVYPIFIFFVIILHLWIKQRNNSYASFFKWAFFVLGLTYISQFSAEIIGLNDLPLMLGPMLFFIILGFLPIYSYFKQQNFIIAQNKAFERFVPKEFLNFIGKKEITEVSLGDQIEEDLTILFSDIRSYTTLSEQLTPQENIKFINQYLTVMVPIIRKHGGFVDKYIGDAIMAIFSEDPHNAVKCAKEMLKTLDKFNRSAPQPLKIGIGIHTGKTMLGVVGEKDRYQGTVISDSVNQASRLESLTKEYPYPLLISKVTADLIQDTIDVQYVDRCHIKGKSHMIDIYTINL